MSSRTRNRPPVAAIHPHRSETHGDVRVDDYRWLRERDNADVLAYLTAENAHTAAVMAATEPLQTQLYHEMRSRIQESDLSVPEEIGAFLYYTRTEEGKQYPLYCRKRGDLESSEEILLDHNALAEGHEYTQIGVLRVSPDHQLLAYSVDHSGQEQYTLYVKDLGTGALLPDLIAGTYYSVEWAADNQTLFYNTVDDTARPDKLFRHILGQDPATDVLIFREPDVRYYLSVRKSKSEQFIFIHLFSSSTNEEWYMPTDRPLDLPRVLQPRRAGLEYNAEHHGRYFYITHNDNALDFQVARAPLTTPDISHWETVIPAQAGVKIDRVEPFKAFLVVHQRKDAIRRLRIIPVDDERVDLDAGHDILFPDEVYTVWGGRNPAYDTARLRLTYTSLVTPATVYDYDMRQRTLDLKKREPVLGGFDPADYVTSRRWATASDGVRVPLSIVHRRDIVLDGRNPTWLYGYGSYGMSIDPTFNSNRLSLLDRGFVYAIAHVRGGGELGRAWYEEGKLLAKKNSFTDFIAAAEHLIEAGYTTPQQLVIAGRSAGGLLIGAVLNLRPDLFRAAIAGVPFVDVVNSMLDPSIPLTTGEYEEWGNPADPVYYDYMKSYSPYDNVAASEYPAILVTAGLNDPRVHYWEPAKWVAKLRRQTAGRQPLLLKTNMNAGHGGASGRFDYLKEVALEYAFFLDALNRSAPE